MSLTEKRHFDAVRATLTSKGQITIPVKIRRRLGLKPGTVLDFDEHASCLRAVPVFDEDAMRTVLGCATATMPMPASDWLEETRGPVELPPHPS